MKHAARSLHPRRKLKILLAALCCAPTLFAPALAGVGEGNGEIGVDFGVAGFDSDLIDKTTYRLSIRLGQHLHEHLQFEGQYAFSPARQELLPGVDKQATLHTLMFNGILNFRPRRSTIVPYVLAGVGLARLELEAVGVSSDTTDGAVQVAAGSRFFLRESGRTALRVEFSLVSNDAFDESYNHLSLGGGLTWRLGPER